MIFDGDAGFFFKVFGAAESAIIILEHERPKDKSNDEGQQHDQDGNAPADQAPFKLSFALPFRQTFFDETAFFLIEPTRFRIIQLELHQLQARIFIPQHVFILLPLLIIFHLLFEPLLPGDFVFPHRMNPFQQSFPGAHQRVMRRLHVIFAFDDQARLHEFLNHCLDALIFGWVSINQFIHHHAPAGQFPFGRNHAQHNFAHRALLRRIERVIKLIRFRAQCAHHAAEPVIIFLFQCAILPAALDVNLVKLAERVREQRQRPGLLNDFVDEVINQFRWINDQHFLQRRHDDDFFQLFDGEPGDGVAPRLPISLQLALIELCLKIGAHGDDNFEAFGRRALEQFSENRHKQLAFAFVAALGEQFFVLVDEQHRFAGGKFFDEIIQNQLAQRGARAE
ncbi:MAG: hypothetical protein ALAOOOJD_02928 [bacterium]|nr:hypothetical protein [bacterium]